MAGLWERTKLVVKSKYSKLLNRAENPTETLDYSYEQMLEQLQNVKRGVADVTTAKNEKFTEELKDKVKQLKQARLPVPSAKWWVGPASLHRSIKVGMSGRNRQRVFVLPVAGMGPRTDSPSASTNLKLPSCFVVRPKIVTGPCRTLNSTETPSPNLP